MIILKHVEYNIKDSSELEKLLNHLRKTTSKVDGVEFKDIYFPIGKAEFVLVIECVNEYKYVEWRSICPPPLGAKDWHEVFLKKDERFPQTNKPNL
ncbi:MAG: hypothetical protein IIA61_07260 [Candidatus Marinimicrobia bacterium]|nr:hypothetical protein [Candidatus Neomarinimicrobiota bacterium]